LFETAEHPIGLRSNPKRKSIIWDLIEDGSRVSNSFFVSVGTYVHESLLA